MSTIKAMVKQLQDQGINLASLNRGDQDNIEGDIFKEEGTDSSDEDSKGENINTI